MGKFLAHFWKSALVCIFLALPAHGIPIPVVSLASVVEGSDLIVVGQAFETHAGQETKEVFENRQVSGRFVHGKIRRAKTLKGTFVASELEFEVFIPDFLADIERIPLDVSRVFFLRQNQGKWTFTTLYRFCIIGIVSDVVVQPDSDFDKVLDSIGAVVLSGMSSTDEKLQAIYELRGINEDRVRRVLRIAINNPEPRIQVSVVVDLLLLGDITALAKAEAALSQPKSALPSYLLHNLAYAVSVGIRDPKAIPLLEKLMKSPYPEARRGAAQSLGKTDSDAAIKAVVVGLRDADLEVRYETVNALATITRQSEWTASLPSYRGNEAPYLKHWREWAKQHSFT